MTGFEVLLAHGLNPEARSSEKCTLLHYAAEMGKVDAVRSLLARHAKTDVFNTAGASPLQWAAEKGRAPVVNQLLAAGARVDAVQRRQPTPLLCAIRSGHQDVARTLIAANADPDAEDDFHRTPFAEAINQGDADLARLMYAKANHAFLHDPQASRVLITQANRGHRAMVGFLLEHRVDPNAEERGASALRAGALKNDPEIARVLLQAGARVDAADPDGRTALGLACLVGATDYANVLLHAGANVKVKAKDGDTALHFAAARDDADLVRALLDRGAEIGAVNANGFRPLDIALLVGSSRIEQLLIEHGAVLDPASKQRTVLMEAVLRRDDVTLLRQALEAGFSPSMRLSSDWPALRVTEAFGARACAALLRERGARLDEPPLALVGPAQLDTLPRPTTVVLPDDPRDPDEEFPAMTVEVDAILTPEGNVLFPGIARTPDPQLAMATLQALGGWRFSPPTRAGHPAWVHIRLPIEFVRSQDRVFGTDRVDIPPQPIKRVPPFYPGRLKRSGIVGRVACRFVVNTDGRVVNIRIHTSTDPEFEKPAITALSQWIFKPGQRDGHPVDCFVEQLIVFNLDR